MKVGNKEAPFAIAVAILVKPPVEECLFMRLLLRMKALICSYLANKLPILSLKHQKIFDKIIPYTQGEERIHQIFYTNMMNRMVEEVYLHELFQFYDVSLLGIVENLDRFGDFPAAQ